jgi:hypothetical protein
VHGRRLCPLRKRKEMNRKSLLDLRFEVRRCLAIAAAIDAG